MPPEPEAEGLVLVNGPPDSVQGPRARALFEGRARIVYKEHGRVGSVRAVWSALQAKRRGWIYCIDLGVPAAPLAAWRRARGPAVRLIYELGDPAGPLFAVQGRPGWQVALAEALDRRLPRRADRLVFRGTYLARTFADLDPRRPLPPWTWLPDGVDTERFRPCRAAPEVHALRARYGLEGRFVAGLVGSLHAVPRTGLFYGWELAEALARIPHEQPITGVVVGDGPGRADLEAARQRLNLGDRLRLVGRVPHDAVPAWMNLFDVGLSTQTDDPIGWGRTTAKLPEYLACGTPVVCSDVGEAHRLLRDSGQTLPYHGRRDDAYPARLAERLQDWLGQDLAPLRHQNRALALELFDYRVLRRRLGEEVLGTALTAKEPGPARG